MAGNAENLPAFDPLIQTENIAFDPNEMIACNGCARMNPPNRLNCLYCGCVLATTGENASSIKPNLRKLEPWERGYNVIVRGRADEMDTAKIAQFLSAEMDDTTSILEAGCPLPLARVESDKEAAMLQVGLVKFGLRCLVISDDDLAAEKPPVRLRRIDLLDGRFALTDFNTGGVTDIGVNDLALIVPGMITASRIDSLEKKRRKGKTKLIDETATTSDETILDIYSRHDSSGFRVHLTGFDFSCLGEDKGLLAGENLRLMTVALKEHAPNAKLVPDYPTIRQALGHVWEIESRKDSLGLQRAGFGKVEFGSAASTSNLRQFTKFSRLQWHLL